MLFAADAQKALTSERSNPNYRSPAGRPPTFSHDHSPAASPKAAAVISPHSSTWILQFDFLHKKGSNSTIYE